MFRLPLLSLFVVVANAKSMGLLQRELARALQDFDIDSFQFNFAGININAKVAQAECPEPWQATISCVISDCPQFMDVCPEITIPPEYQGTAPPAASPTAEGALEDAVGDMVNMTDDMGDAMGNTSDGMLDGMANMTDLDDEMGNVTEPGGEMVNMTEMDGNLTQVTGRFLQGNDTTSGNTSGVATTAIEVPTCEEIEDEFCSTFSGDDLAECCLVDCASALKDLLVCLVLKTTGEDRSDCEVPVCPTSAPAAEESATPAPGPSGSSSSAAVVISRIAVLVAGAFAFVML